MLNFLDLPYLQHPLFERELRRTGHTTHNRPVVLILAIIAPFSVWFISLLNVLPCGYGMPCPSYIQLYGWQTLSWLLLISVGANVLLDLLCIALTLNSLNRQAQPVDWDLLRLTMLPPESIVAAQHTIAQVRAWRWMQVISGVRLACTVLVIIQIILPAFTRDAYGRFWSDFALLSPSLAIMGGTYIIEPLWRMRAMTALGLWLSARLGNITLNILAGLFAILVVWVSQGLVLGAVFWIMVQVLMGFSSNFALCGVFFFVAITAVLVYVYYRKLLSWSLARAALLVSSEA